MIHSHISSWSVWKRPLHKISCYKTICFKFAISYLRVTFPQVSHHLLVVAMWHFVAGFINHVKYVPQKAGSGLVRLQVEDRLKKVFNVRMNHVLEENFRRTFQINKFEEINDNHFIQKFDICKMQKRFIS